MGDQPRRPNQELEGRRDETTANEAIHDDAPLTDHSRPDDSDLVFAGAEVGVTISVLRPEADADDTYRMVTTPGITKGEARATNRRLVAAGLPPVMSEEVRLPAEPSNARAPRLRGAAHGLHVMRLMRAILGPLNSRS